MPADLTAIVERELGTTPADVTRVDEGLLHETYTVRCNGTEYILQFASDVDDTRRDALERSLACYALFQDSGIPVPTPVTGDVEELDGRRYSLVEKLPGTTGERDISPERTRNAARYLAKIHDAATFGTAGWLQFEDRDPSVREFQAGSLRGRLRQRVAENAAVFRQNDMADVGNALQGLFERDGATLPAEFQPVLCHSDYSPDNVLFVDSEVTGILDFDRACASHDQHDVVQAANAFWMHDPCSDWNVRTTFYAGYRTVAPLPASFEQSEPVYRVETLANTVAGLLEMDDLSGYERDFYADRLAEAIERAGGA